MLTGGQKLSSETSQLKQEWLWGACSILLAKHQSMKESSKQDWGTSLGDLKPTWNNLTGSFPGNTLYNAFDGNKKEKSTSTSFWKWIDSHWCILLNKNSHLLSLINNALIVSGVVIMNNNDLHVREDLQERAFPLSLVRFYAPRVSV